MRRAALVLLGLFACGGSGSRATTAPPSPKPVASATASAQARANYKCPPGKKSAFTVLSEGAPTAIPLPEKKKRRNAHAQPPPEPATLTLRDIAWGPDDAAILLVTELSDSNGTLESRAMILDLATGNVRAQIDARAGSRSPYGQRFESAAWSADGSLIAIVRSDGIALWDGRSTTPGSVVPNPVIDNDPLVESDDRALVFAPIGHLFATWVPAAKQLRLYDGKDAATKPLHTITPSLEGTIDPYAFAFNADGSRLGVAVEANTSSERLSQVIIYDTSNGAVAKTLHSGSRRNDARGRPMALYWTPKSRAIVTVDSYGKVDLWNTGTDDPPSTLLELGASGPSALVDNGNLLLLGAGGVIAWDLRSRAVAQELSTDAAGIEHLRPNRGATAVAISRGDRIEVLRLADKARLTIRTTPTGVLVHSDTGLHAGARDGPAQLRTRLEGQTTRPLRTEEATFRPTLAQDFLAGCPMGTL